MTGKHDRGDRGVGHGTEPGLGRMHGHAVGQRGVDVATGTITSISATAFVLATEQGELTVLPGADTNVHGLSRRQAREAGYEDPTAINTFAALKVGQRVAVMGERRPDATLLATRVHVVEP